jgi:hypothetical protein
MLLNPCEMTTACVGSRKVTLSGNFKVEVSQNPCRLNRSMQHYLEVYLPEFESPKFVAGVD